MTDKQQILNQLPAPEKRELLVALVGAHERAAAGDKLTAPLVTLLLTSGSAVTGRAIKLQDNSRALTLLLQTEDGTGLIYLSVGAIVAVNVHNAFAHVVTLSDGKIEAMPGEPAPSRLELKRRAVSVSEELSTALGFELALEIAFDGIKPEEPQLRSLATWLDEIPSVVRQIVEEYGVDALRGRVGTIRIDQDSRSQVALVDSTLVFTADFGAGRGGRLDRAGLRSAIDAAL